MTDNALTDNALTSALVTHYVGTVAARIDLSIECTATSLSLPDNTSPDQWAGVGYLLAAQEVYSGAALKWFIGDWLLHGEEKLGDVYTQYLGPETWDYKTVQNCRWVASRISAERRRADLSFAHHAEVAGLPPVVQDRLLSLAASEGMSRDDFRAHIKGERQTDRPADAPNAPSVKIALTVDALETTITEMMTERQQAELVDRLAETRNGLRLSGLGTELTRRQFDPAQRFDPALRSALLNALPVSELLSAAMRRMPEGIGVPPPYMKKAGQLCNWIAKYEEAHPEEPCAGEMTDGDAPDLAGDFSGDDFSDDVPVPFVLTEDAESEGK